MQLAKSTITVEHQDTKSDRSLIAEKADAVSRIVTRRSDFEIQWSAETTTADNLSNHFVDVDMEVGKEAATFGLQSSISLPLTDVVDTQAASIDSGYDRLPELVLDPNVGMIELTSSLPTLADPAQEFNSKQNSKPVIVLPPLDLRPLHNQLLIEANSAKRTAVQSLASGERLVATCYSVE